MTPPHGFIIPSDDTSDSGRRSVCNRVRITSWGYVAIEAVIFERAEHMRILSLESGLFESRSIGESRTEGRWLWTVTYVLEPSVARTEETERRRAVCLEC